MPQKKINPAALNKAPQSQPSKRADELQKYYGMRFDIFVKEVAKNGYNELDHVNGSHQMFQRTVDGESQFLNLQPTKDGKPKLKQIIQFYGQINPDDQEINVLEDFADLIEDYSENVNFATLNLETKKQYARVLLQYLDKIRKEPFDAQIININILNKAMQTADQLLLDNQVIDEPNQKFLINSLFLLIINFNDYKTINLSLNFRNKLLQLFKTPKEKVASILGQDFVISLDIPSNYIIENTDNQRFIISINQNGEILQITQFDQNKYTKNKFFYKDSNGNIEFMTLSELIKNSDRSVDRLRLCEVAANKITEEIVFGIKVQLGETISPQQQLVDNKIVTFSTYMVYGDYIENEFIPKVNLFSLEYGSKIPLIKPALINFSHGKIIGSADLETIFIESNQGYFTIFRFNSSGEKIIIDYFYRKNNPVLIPQLPNQEFCKQYPIDAYIRINAIDHANVSEFIEKLEALKFEMKDFEDHLEQVVIYDKINHEQKQLILKPYRKGSKRLNSDLLLTWGLLKIIDDSLQRNKYWNTFNWMSANIIKKNHSALISVDKFLELEKSCNNEPQAQYNLYQKYYFSQVGKLKGYLCYKLAVYYDQQGNFNLTHIYLGLGTNLKSGESFYYRAKLFESYGKDEIAKKRYLRALNTNTKYVQIELKQIAAINLAKIYAQDDIGKSIQYFTIAIELGSKDAYVGLAELYLLREQYSEAITNLNIALDLIERGEIKDEKLYAKVYFILGKIRLENKYLDVSIEKAIDYLEQATYFGNYQATIKLVNYYEQNEKFKLEYKWLLSIYASDSYGSQIKAYAAYRLAKWYSKFEPNEKKKIEKYFNEADDLIEPGGSYYQEIISNNPYSSKANQYIRALELEYFKNKDKDVAFSLALRCFEHTDSKIQKKAFGYFNLAHKHPDLNTQVSASLFLLMILLYELCGKKFDSRQVQSYIKFIQNSIDNIQDNDNKLYLQIKFKILTAEYHIKLKQYDKVFQIYSQIYMQEEYSSFEWLYIILKLKLAQCYQHGVGTDQNIRFAKILYMELYEKQNYYPSIVYLIELNGYATEEQINQVRNLFDNLKSGDLSKKTPFVKFMLVTYAKLLIRYEKDKTKKAELSICVNLLTQNQLHQIEYELTHETISIS